MTNLNLEEIRANLDEVRRNIDHAEAQHNPHALTALRVAEKLDVEVRALWDNLARMDASEMALATERDRLLAEIQRYRPVCDPSGDALYIHNHDGIGGYRCGNTEWWNEAICGPINEQGCDACESGGDGSWRPLYIREAVTR